MRKIIIVLVAYIPAWAFAAAESSDVINNTRAVSNGVVNNSPSLMLLQTLFGLLLVIGCIFLLAWAAKKFNLTQMGGNKNFTVVASLALSNREKAVLIQVGEQQILLGVAPGNVRQLQVFDEPVVAPENKHQVNKTSLAASTATEFSKKLNDFLSQGNKT